MNDKVKAWVEKTPAKKINVCFAYNEDTQEIILTKDGVINRIDVSTLIAHNEKDDTETIFIPEDATNGDVIKAVFQNVEIIPNSYTPSVDLSVGGIMMMRVDRNWWNAPYKGDQE